MTDIPPHISLSYSWTTSSPNPPSSPSAPSAPHYLPSPEDVGHRIRCRITPSTESAIGLPVTVTFPNPVLPVPTATNPLFSNRASFLSTPLPSSSLRIVTYNILADLYTSQKAQQKTMWSYTSPKFLHSSHRMPLILCELIYHSPTIILLQEVDTTAYEALFSPVLSALGYEGAFGEKCGKQREGVAIFWRTDEFELVEKEVRVTAATHAPSANNN